MGATYEHLLCRGVLGGIAASVGETRKEVFGSNMLRWYPPLCDHPSDESRSELR
jgi:hypothetical protein